MAEKTKINEHGDVGIGTESPQKDLHLHQANSNTLFEALTIRTNSAGEGLTLGINSTNDGFITSQVGTALRLAGDSQSYATGHLLIYSGSGNIEAVKGNISGSATSTGSIAYLNIGGTSTTNGGTILRAGETQVAAGANLGDAGARYVFNVDSANPYVGVGIIAENHNPHHLSILNKSYRSDGNFNYAQKGFATREDADAYARLMMKTETYDKNKYYLFEQSQAYSLDEKNYFTSGPNKGQLIPATENQLKNTKYSDKAINEEIDNTRAVRGQFQTTEVEGQTVGEEET